MRHVIHCSGEYEFEKDVNDDDNVEDILKNVFKEYIDIDNAILNVIAAVQSPVGFFPYPNEIEDDIYDNARKNLREELASVVIYERTIADDGCIASSIPIDICSVIDELIDERAASEQSYIDAGCVMIDMLTAFLDEGVWQFGLRDEEGSVLSDASQWPKPTIDGDSISWKGSNGVLTPIIWFGLEDEDPIECWSITLDSEMFEPLDLYPNPYATKTRAIEKWKSFWFCDFWCFDWNALLDNNGDCYITWMFAECGMSEPEYELNRVRESCPIELTETDTGEILAKKINYFFEKKYKEAAMQKDAHEISKQENIN